MLRHIDSDIVSSTLHSLEAHLLDACHLSAWAGSFDGSAGIELVPETANSPRSTLSLSLNQNIALGAGAIQKPSGRQRDRPTHFR